MKEVEKTISLTIKNKKPWFYKRIEISIPKTQTVSTDKNENE